MPRLPYEGAGLLFAHCDPQIGWEVLLFRRAIPPQSRVTFDSREMGKAPAVHRRPPEPGRGAPSGLRRTRNALLPLRYISSQFY